MAGRQKPATKKRTAARCVITFPHLNAAADYRMNWVARLNRNGNATRGSLSRLLHQNWVPLVISSVLAAGGGLVLARYTAETTQEKLYLEKKIEHADGTAKALAKYTSDWGRIKTLCDALDAAGGRLDTLPARSKERRELERLIQTRAESIRVLAASRNASRDELFGRLGSLVLYFNPAVVAAAADFELWDRQWVIAPCKELPQPDAWARQRHKLLQAIRTEVSPK